MNYLLPNTLKNLLCAAFVVQILLGLQDQFVYAKKTEHLSTFEGQDTSDTYPTIILEDSTFAHFNNCVIRNFADIEEPLRSLYVRNKDSVLLIDNNFYGAIDLQQPQSGQSGDINFYGNNSIIKGGVNDDTDPSKRFGKATKMHAEGDTCFSGHNPDKIVYVNGMPGSAKVTISYKHTEPVTSYDAIYAIEVPQGGDYFIVHRGDNQNNTSDLWFYWRADWEEDE